MFVIRVDELRPRISTYESSREHSSTEYSCVREFINAGREHQLSPSYVIVKTLERVPLNNGQLSIVGKPNTGPDTAPLKFVRCTLFKNGHLI